ncbi:triple tyrosine motif-containing protein [Dysgonomonas macrotermitis]|uniref:Y_Y_Y domain-containing protein n=1 Tax=Dysgonomonas macrotermitis TaxID=1346286 RepID=A0A1M4TMV9_9BACT|nr:triple tyrosine motif-containing protein [Dysgonomonas macrotermitis]SHE45829.1 Y_Y_Y domain-containing protein [Dysgonomonas macrotermitis]
MKIFLNIVLLVLFIPSVYPSIIWQRDIINYERNAYTGGSQNWMVKQHPVNKKIYIANSSGLLEFDGIYWSLYPIRNSIVRSIEIKGNRIYIGGSSELGYFEANDTGMWIYHSLTKFVPEWRGEVWNIFVRNKKIYFQDEGNILVYDEKENIRIIQTGIKIDCASLINNHIYLGSTDGIYYLNQNDNIISLLDSENLKGEKIVSILPYENKLLITSARNGLYFLGDKKKERVILPSAQNFINNNQLFCASLKDSLLALGSVQNGMLLVDLEKPQYHEEFNLNNGLLNNTILSSLFDKEGNLWIGLNQGISYIDIMSAIRPMFSINSPIGAGYCSAIYNNEVYLGTNQGLYKTDSKGLYSLIKDSEGQIWSLSTYDQTLFSTGDAKILVIENGKTYSIPLSGIWEVHPLLAYKDKMIASSYSGLRILSKNSGRWGFSHNVADFYNSCRGFFEDEPNVFWIMGSENTVIRIKLDKELMNIVEKKEYILNGQLNSENPFFKKIDNTIFICSKKGILKYEKMSDKFIPFTELEYLLEGPRKYDHLSIDNNKNIWFVTDNNLKLLPYNNGYGKKIYTIGLSNELINSYENIMTQDTASVIVGVARGFVNINLPAQQKESAPFSVAIRKIVATDIDSVLFYEKAKIPLEIPYSLNSINIQFASPEYANQNEIVYAVRLLDIDERWSTPSSKTNKEYTRLPEGKYTFEVMAFRKGETHSSVITKLTFRVLPPWYRSFWAYLTYTIIILASIYVFYRRTIGRQKRIIDEKGKELIAQHEKHNEEQLLKDKEIYELQNENLRNKLSYKAQELSGYILNLARKNEMLEDVKRSAFSISKAIDDNKQPIVIKQKVVSLISQINNNIEHDKDFEVFQSNFNVLHADFFNLLEKRFTNLTRNEKVLCAYLKMNLSSKEIASLMNITIRGVEVSRYRLRKKLGIDTDINLNDYMNNIK